MTGSEDDQMPHDVSALPIQPTGSGVADLEVAYEQMKLAEGAPEEDRQAGELAADRGEDVSEVEAHPS